MNAKRFLAGVVLAAAVAAAKAQKETVQQPAGPASKAETGCCGPVTVGGAKLAHFLDDMHVDRLWLPHTHIDWATGFKVKTIEGREPPTHCSAFAAAVAMRLNIYLLRPPDHDQMMLTLGQERWLNSKEARSEGWRRVSSALEAQMLANRGELVLLLYARERGSGHVAIVRPALKSEEAFEKDGPETAQAGGNNFADGNAKFSFVFHPGAWPDEVKIFAHTTAFETQP